MSLQTSIKSQKEKLKIFYLYSVINIIMANIVYILFTIFTKFQSIWIYAWGFAFLIFTVIPILLMKRLKENTSILPSNKEQPNFKLNIILFSTIFVISVAGYIVLSLIYSRYTLGFLGSLITIYFVHISVYIEN